MSRIPRGWSSWLVLGLIVALVASASAGLITKPYTFSPGTSIKSAEVNSDFDTLYNWANGDVDDANISSLSESKLVFSATGHAHSGGTGGAPVQLVDGTNITAASSITIPTDGNFFTVTGSTTINALSTRNAGVFAVLYFTGTPTITHNGTSLILFGATTYTVTAGDVLTFKSLGSGNWRQVAGPNTLLAGAGITITRGPNIATAARTTAPNVQVFTGNGTWTKPGGLVKVKVTVVGGGAGGGTGGSSTDSASGGGGGGTCLKWIAAASLGATESVTVGASASAAGAGNSSSFGSHCSSTGGSAGSSSAVGTAGGAGGVGSSGDVNIKGGGGGPGMPGTGRSGGTGGNSSLGAGAAGSAANGVGQNGGNYGGGGGGGGSDGVNISGGTGAAGVVIVEEH